jgi:ATP/maltotriose-dependent transcriptional regulator MalT
MKREQTSTLIARARTGNQPRLLAQALVLQAEIDACTGDHAAGLAALDEAGQLLDRIHNDQIRIQWLTTHSRIDDERGEFAAAVQALEQALELARSSWGERDLRTLTIRSDLASMPPPTCCHPQDCRRAPRN